MIAAEAVNYWLDLEALAGAGVKVHLTGGEPFGNWPGLLAILQAARARGLQAHEVETNAFWCTDRLEVQRRCEQLNKVGIGRLVVSCDVYHQQYVPYERVARLVEAGRKVLGSERVRIRWRDFFANPVEVGDLPLAQRKRLYLQAWANHPDRLTGRAAEQIAPLLEMQSPQAFAGHDCSRAILSSRHVHIDPLGNVFPGVCAGLVLGNALEGGLRRVRDRLRETEDDVLGRLIEFGPWGLMELARQYGYRPNRRGFAAKCHLCSEVRSFLFEKGEFTPTVGPAQCYRQD